MTGLQACVVMFIAIAVENQERAWKSGAGYARHWLPLVGRRAARRAWSYAQPRLRLTSPLACAAQVYSRLGAGQFFTCSSLSTGDPPHPRVCPQIKVCVVLYPVITLLMLVNLSTEMAVRK
jgi:hypothetical protein